AGATYYTASLIVLGAAHADCGGRSDDPLSRPQHQRIALATGAAQSRDRVARTTPGQLQRRVQRDTRTGRPDRVADGDGAAVDVDDVGVEAEFLGGGERHRGERLVDLHDVELVDGDALPGDRLLDRVRRLGLQRRVGAGHHTVRADLTEPGQAHFLGLLLAHHHDRGRPVGDLRRRTGGDGAVFAERRLEPGQRFEGGVGPDALVLEELDRVALALRDLDRNDLVGEDAVLPRRGGLLVRPDRELVLLLAGELVDVVALFGQRAHRLIGEHVVQTVIGYVVEHGDVAVLVSGPAVHQQVRRPAHRLLAAGDHHV